MLKIVTCLTLVAVLFILLPSLRSTAQQPNASRQLEQPESRQQKVGPRRRTALIIGNGDYQNASSLPNPPNDAQDMATALRELGFELIGGKAHVNQTVDQMKRLIVEFGQKLSEAHGVGLFYYAGHGVQSQGHNYLIPIEVKALRAKTIEFDAVDVNRVLSEMDSAGNAFNLLILDACRSNPFASSWRDSGQGLAQINVPEGTLIAYATSPGKVASDGMGRNGTYTSVLLQQIRVPKLTIEEMFKNVRARVKSTTNNQQTPWESSSLVGQFCFVGDCEANDVKVDASANPNATPSNIADPDAEFWNSIKNSNDLEDFRAYKKAFPSGRYIAIADNTLRRLESKASESRPIDENGPPAFPPVARIPHGPANLGSRLIYQVKAPHGKVVEVVLKAEAVLTNDDNELEARVFALKGQASSHLWDSKWYYWRLSTRTKLLLAWHSLTQDSAGWILIQKQSNVWWYKTNEGRWNQVGADVNAEFWDLNGAGSRVRISFRIPNSAGDWTTDDVEYSFGN